MVYVLVSIFLVHIFITLCLLVSLSLSLFSTARFPDSPCNSTRSSFFRRYRGSGRERVRDYEDDLEKAGREMSAKEENEEKKERRESPPMNHSRRYRPIWTSSPACSKHVYLRFRVSTSRHCTRCSPSLSLSPFLRFARPFSPHRRCIDIAEAPRVSPSRVR